MGYRIFNYFKNHKIIFCLLILAGFVNLGFIIPNGNYHCVADKCDVFIGEWHFNDALWHLALAVTAFNTYPFQMPIFSGANLQGYNYLLDLIVFLISKIGIPPIFTFFKILPIIYFISLSFFGIRYALNQSKSSLFTFSILFFLLCGNSFTYLLALYHKGTIVGSTLWEFPVFHSLQSSSALLNLQFAFSSVLILVALILIKKEIKNTQIFILAVLIFLSTSMKFYAGITLLFLLFIYELLLLIKKKNIYAFITSCGLFGLFFIFSIFIFYDPLSSAKTGSTFSFAPLALVHPIIENTKLAYMKNLTLARYTLYQGGLFSPRLIAIESLSMGLFLLLNFGTRIVGVIYIFKQIKNKKITELEISMLLTILFLITATLLFVQKGGWFNTIQFLYYAVFLMNFFAAKFLYDLLKSKKIILLLTALLVIILTLPNIIDQSRYVFMKQRKIPSEEISALTFLGKLPEGAVFTLPADSGPAYISAFSHKPVYFGDTHVLDITGIDYKKRKESVKDIKSLDLSKIDTTYFYLNKTDKDFSAIQQKLTDNYKYKKIYENSVILIYRKYL